MASTAFRVRCDGSESMTANAAATLLRFVLFRGWVFRARTRSTHDAGPAVVEMEIV